MMFIKPKLKIVALFTENYPSTKYWRIGVPPQFSSMRRVSDILGEPSSRLQVEGLSTPTPTRLKLKLKMKIKYFLSSDCLPIFVRAYQY